MTHTELCERAAQWLRGTKRCNPVFGGVASTAEVPDVIGWFSHGSIVVECKASLVDFYADAQKYVRWKHPQWAEGQGINGSGRIKQLKQAGYTPIAVPSMGTYRYFLCDPEVIDVEKVKECRVDHGLLHVYRRRIKVVLPAPRREAIDLDSEIRCLRFGLVHLTENLLRLGCSLDLGEATKMRGERGITLPGRKEVAGPLFQMESAAN